MVAVAAGTGLRVSELLGLRWQDANLDDGLLHVRSQLSKATGKKPARLVALKTGAGERDVYLVAELGDLLKAHKVKAFRHGRARPDDFIFCTRDGKPLSQRNACRALRSAGDKAALNPDGIEPVSWHDLRHTAISRLIAAGLDVVQVQRQAGHARPSITLDVYSHEFERAKRSEDVRAKIAATGVGEMLWR
jgi:integrase